MSDDSAAPADLSSLEADLTQIFRPSWTMEASDSTARLTARFDEGDRPERGPRRPEGRGGPGRDRGSRDRGPRPDRGSGPRGDKGGPGRDRGDRSKRGGHDRRDARDRRPEPAAPKPMLEGWELSLLPEEAAVEGIAKQIRSRAKAYPLFELARLIVRLSDRYSVALKSSGTAEGAASGLFRVKADGSLWTSRKEAVSHLLAKHLAKFYRATSVTVEPPKGAFTVVAQCGMSGTVLGPPNHHEYTTRLIALHASRFKNLPFEVFKSRIRMVRDEAVIEQWKTDQSTRTVYTPIEPGSEQEATAAEEPVSLEIAETVAATPDETASPAAESTGTEETPPAADHVVEPAAEVAAEETSSEPSAEVPSEAPAEETPSEEAQPEAAAPAGETVNGLTLQEVTAHFQEHHAAAEIEEAPSELTVAGGVALHASTPLLRELLLNHLRELDRFPLPLAHIVSKELSNRGLQLFKAHFRKIVHVSMARPKYLDRTTTPIAENFGAILDYLEAHPKQPRDKQWAGLLALRTETGETEEETRQRREQALGADLLWLLHQGHVIDFAMGNLQAATPPKPQPVKDEKKTAEASKEAVADSSATPAAEPATEATEAPASSEAPEAHATPAPEAVSPVEETTPGA
jgi:hypothetical protein